MKSKKNVTIHINIIFAGERKMRVECPKCNSPLDIENEGVYQCSSCGCEIEIVAIPTAFGLP